MVINKLQDAFPKSLILLINNDEKAAKEAEMTVFTTAILIAAPSPSF